MANFQYYDFDIHWNEFYQIWQSDPVQEILKPDMDEWCQTQAYYLSNGKRPTWNKGEPLWHLSRTDYHDNKMMELANDKVEKEHIYATYKKRMEQITGKKFIHNDYDETFNRCFEEVMEGFEPKRHTIDSLILVLGKNYIHAALCKCAQLLFPDDDIDEVETSDADTIVVNCNKRIVFDLLNFYFSTRHKYIDIDNDMIDSFLDTFDYEEQDF